MVIIPLVKKHKMLIVAMLFINKLTLFMRYSINVHTSVDNTIPSPSVAPSLKSPV